MKFNHLVIDNFIDNPYEMRDVGLRENFDNYNPSNYPGRRTKAYPQESILAAFRKVLKPYYSEVMFNSDITNGQFQLTTINDKSWIHQDNVYESKRGAFADFNSISAVLYLTPNAPFEAGTSFYHNEFENNIKNSLDDINKDICKHSFKHIGTVANVFNRVIIFDASIYHTANSYFGTNIYDGRLTTTYFLLAK